jgi:hypothetical protein
LGRPRLIVSLGNLIVSRSSVAQLAGAYVRVNSTKAAGRQDRLMHGSVLHTGVRLLPMTPRLAYFDHSSVLEWPSALAWRILARRSCAGSEMRSSAGLVFPVSARRDSPRAMAPGPIPLCQVVTAPAWVLGLCTGSDGEGPVRALDRTRGDVSGASPVLGSDGSRRDNVLAFCSDGEPGIEVRRVRSLALFGSGSVHIGVCLIPAY